jgi:hypothetical protein
MRLLFFLPHCKGQPTADAAVIANAATTRRLCHHPLEAWRGAVVVVIVPSIALTIVRPVAATVARVAIVITMMMRSRSDAIVSPARGRHRRGIPARPNAADRPGDSERSCHVGRRPR